MPQVRGNTTWLTNPRVIQQPKMKPVRIDQSSQKIENGRMDDNLREELSNLHMAQHRSFADRNWMIKEVRGDVEEMHRIKRESRNCKSAIRSLTAGTTRGNSQSPNNSSKLNSWVHIDDDEDDYVEMNKEVYRPKTSKRVKRVSPTRRARTALELKRDEAKMKEQLASEQRTQTALGFERDLEKQSFQELCFNGKGRKLCDDEADMRRMAIRNARKRMLLADEDRLKGKIRQFYQDLEKLQLNPQSRTNSTSHSFLLPKRQYKSCFRIF
ncbi:unnamed protein product [Dimorphilus gyrociliatus]|uniref:Uncharacterized protein n=1 Tax=Dimorphilus gyrociliatus TaxID=2664684 RepID=A0A7I8VLN7_9ANNE|nr:unnamed protein product [Dimorphilus gyrociliatus]